MVSKIRSLAFMLLLVMLFSGVVYGENAAVLGVAYGTVRTDLPQNDGAAVPLLDRIAQGENTGFTGDMYNRINSWYETRKAALVATSIGTPPKKPLTEMTINEVIAFQDTLGKNTPVGKYQIIESTLIDLINRYNIHPGDLFDANMQNKLALTILNECGYKAWKAGAKSDKDFQYNIAGRWASVEDPNNPGMSRWDINGNPCGSTKAKCQPAPTTTALLKAVMGQIKSAAVASATVTTPQLHPIGYKPSPVSSPPSNQPSTPPVQPSIPPVQPSIPPVQPSIPPVQPSTPPVQPSTPPVQPSTPPVQPRLNNASPG